MTRARPWFRSLARWYARRRVARAFDGLFVEGLDEARSLSRARPLVLAMNHVAWWDAFVVVLLDEALAGEGRCLMDADNLGRLPFFGWLGAVPLHRDRPRRALRDLAAESRWLDRPGRSTWIFPQGHQRPAHLRPLGLARGVGVLASGGDAAVVPVALSYAFREGPAPTICVSFRPPVEVPRRSPPLALERAIEAGLERNDAFVIGARSAHQPLLPPRAAAPLTLSGRVLARLAGGIAHG